MVRGLTYQETLRVLRVGSKRLAELVRAHQILRGRRHGMPGGRSGYAWEFDALSVLKYAADRRNELVRKAELEHARILAAVAELTSREV